MKGPGRPATALARHVPPVDSPVREPIVGEMKRVLGTHLERLPPRCREAAEAVVEMPEQFFDAEDVACRTGVSRRQLDRVLRDVHLASVKNFVIACGAYTALRLLACERVSIDAAARAVGYDSERGFRRHAEAIWSVGPRAATAFPLEATLEALLRFIDRESTHHARLDD